MKILTKEIIREFEKTGRQETTPIEDKICVVKIFNPAGDGTWYLTEFDEAQGEFFGLVDIHGELEWGYSSLEEMQAIKGPLGIGLERDLYGNFPKKFSEIKALDGRL